MLHTIYYFNLTFFLNETSLPLRFYLSFSQNVDPLKASYNSASSIIFISYDKATSETPRQTHEPIRLHIFFFYFILLCQSLTKGLTKSCRGTFRERTYVATEFTVARRVIRSGLAVD